MEKVFTKILSICLSPQIGEAMRVACEFMGMRQSQFGRQAILEKLVREGYMEHPAAQILRKNNAKSAPPLNGDAPRAG